MFLRQAKSSLRIMVRAIIPWVYRWVLMTKTGDKKYLALYGASIVLLAISKSIRHRIPVKEIDEDTVHKLC